MERKHRNRAAERSDDGAPRAPSAVILSSLVALFCRRWELSNVILTKNLYIEKCMCYRSKQASKKPSQPGKKKPQNENSF
mmetsp:Transcript_37752/g.118194  ORF Transcript_37752/g.118194 Transcript_37752/m.118194 type:complete len:80 (+) Transcript_37752:333-572(+)